MKEPSEDAVSIAFNANSQTYTEASDLEQYQE